MSKKPRQKIDAPGPAQSRALRASAIAIAVLTLVVFWNVLGNNFLTYDDPEYVTDNPDVVNGLTWAGVHGAFTHIVASNWQPVTVLSHQLDVSLFGLNPRGHHLTSLALHIANAILLLYVLHRLTGDVYKSAIVAALFAIHPLHVEPVAWISSRKDVLSTFFMLIALLAYARYARKPSLSSYTLVAVAFALGLMAKSMLVTFPFLLLLLDYWPLQRLQGELRTWRPQVVALLREKLPLIGITVVFSIVAVITQHKGQAIQSADEIDLYERVTNAVQSYALYVAKMVWPSPLAIFYPHPGEGIPMWKVGAALLFLVVVTAIALRTWRTRPAIVVGWFWYLGTLVPVIGLIQIGSLAMADRYTYITLIGVFIALVWGIGSLIGPRGAKPALAIAVVAIAVFGAVAHAYVAEWRDTESLFRHALKGTEKNYPAHVNLAMALAERGELGEAITHFEAATKVEPRAVEAWFNLGVAYEIQNDLPRAADAFRAAADVATRDIDVRVRLASVYVKLGRKDDAIAALREAQGIDAADPGVISMLQQLGG